MKIAYQCLEEVAGIQDDDLWAFSKPSFHKRMPTANKPSCEVKIFCKQTEQVLRRYQLLGSKDSTVQHLLLGTESEDWDSNPSTKTAKHKLRNILPSEQPCRGWKSLERVKEVPQRGQGKEPGEPAWDRQGHEKGLRAKSNAGGWEKRGVTRLSQSHYQVLK